MKSFHLSKLMRQVNLSRMRFTDEVVENDPQANNSSGFTAWMHLVRHFI